MTADVFGERVLSYKEPMWHSLGLVPQEPMTAVEAFTAVGPYQVTLEPLRIDRGPFTLTKPENWNDSEEEWEDEVINVPMIEDRAIVRHPTVDDPDPRVFGIVGSDYTLIDPMDFCKTWDTRVQKHVETFGVLGEGNVLFITTKLPTIDIKGDEVEMYLAGINPMTGSDAAEARVTPVRIVCRNTLRLSASIASERYRIIHDEQALDRIGRWLGDLYVKAETKAAAIKEAFEILAGARVQSASDLEQVLEEAYPIREMPIHNAPPAVMEKRVHKAELRNAQIIARRVAATGLFEGSGLGMDHPAAKGTYWGLYNAVAETENYRRSRSLETASEEVLFGRRGAVMERAFEASLRIASAAS